VIVGAALLMRGPNRDRPDASGGFVRAAASPTQPPSERVLARGSSYVVVQVQRPTAAPTATPLVRIDISGRFVPGDDVAQIYLDGVPVGVGQESADLGTLSAVVTNPGALREGAVVSYRYRSNASRRVEFPDRLHLLAGP
jgi:hypothetical protein